MKVLYPLVTVVVLALIALLGVAIVDLRIVFGIILPYAAIAIFIIGFIYRIWSWAKSPVPFRITTTCGQQTSLPWIKKNNLENPYNTLGVIGRMALEVLLFRSLFRNTSSEVRDKKIIYGEEKLLWIAGLAFHWSMLIIVLRHFRYFTEPVPGFVLLLQTIDGFFQVGVPAVYITSVLVIVALAYLFIRRIVLPQVRYISLPTDYFPLFLLLGIAISGFLMRHIYRVDIEAVKELAIGLVSLSPVLPTGVGPIFYAHIFLVSVLLAYFPLSKLMHAGGIFLSPTRNLAANSRMRRHINPWNPPVKVHTYPEWEEEFKKQLLAADYELDADSEEKQDILV
jgi:nitrate reductase gamma subunit